MRKITPVEIFVLVLVAIGVSFYLVPKITLSLEQKHYGRVQTNAAMMTSKILSYFSDTKEEKLPSEIAKSIAEEMNKVVKNPINKENPAYSIMNECDGCVVVRPDDKVKNIVLTAKDKEGKLLTRTVIQPPSYVTFNRDSKENEK